VTGILPRLTYMLPIEAGELNPQTRVNEGVNQDDYEEQTTQALAPI
jgi:hypothetical protein